jgi:hypothetical protein
MTHYVGQAMEVELTSGGAITGVREVNIPEDHPAPDVTHAGDTHGQSIPGDITYRNGCSMTIVDDDGEAAWDALVPGTEDTLKFYPRGKVAGQQEISGAMVITNRSRVVQYNDAVVFTVTFNLNSFSDGAYSSS